MFGAVIPAYHQDSKVDFTSAMGSSKVVRYEWTVLICSIAKIYIPENAPGVSPRPKSAQFTHTFLTSTAPGTGSPLDVGNIADPSLPGAPGLEPVELSDVARLDGQVVLPGVLGRKVLCAQDLGGPRVPHGGVGEGLAPVDGDAGLAVVVEHDGCHRCGAVDAVRLTRDAQRVRGLGDDGVVLRLVLVGGALQA